MPIDWTEPMPVAENEAIIEALEARSAHPDVGDRLIELTRALEIAFVVPGGRMSHAAEAFGVAHRNGIIFAAAVSFSMLVRVPTDERPAWIERGSSARWSETLHQWIGLDDELWVDVKPWPAAGPARDGERRMVGLLARAHDEAGRLKPDAG